MPFNTAALNVMLDALDEGQAAGIDFVGIHQLTQTPPTQATPGTGTNADTTASPEATGGGYARLGVVWAAAASGQKTGSSGTLTFDVAAGTYAFFGLYNASTGNTNNYLGYIPFGGATALKGFASTDPTLTNDQFFSVAHGMADNDRVLLDPVFSETVPSGITAGAVYYVVNSATNTFKVSTTQGGAAVDITALNGGEVYWQRVVPEVFGATGQITVAANQLILDATGI